MLFAVVQDELKPLNPSEVTDLYADVYGLNKIDARNIVLKRPRGILAFGLDNFQAERLSYGLRMLNYQCHKQAINSLHPMPDLMPVYSAYLYEDGIHFSNLLGESSKILWNHLQMIEVYRIHNKSVTISNRKKAKRIGKPSTVTVRKESIVDGYYLEIYSDSPYPRIQIDASRFNYSAMGDSMSRDSMDNFLILISRIKEHADKFKISFSDTSQKESFSSLKDFEAYSHWRLQSIDY